MKIEKAIQQSKSFDNPYQKVGVNLIYTHNWMMGKLKSYFAQYGVTVKQFNIMRILKGAGKPVSTSYLRDRLLDKSSDVSRIVDRMEVKGWIDKTVCPNDKRLVDVQLNKQGDTLLDIINQEFTIMNDIFSNLSVEEVHILNQLLDKMRTN